MHASIYKKKSAIQLVVLPALLANVIANAMSLCFLKESPLEIPSHNVVPCAPQPVLPPYFDKWEPFFSISCSALERGAAHGNLCAHHEINWEWREKSD